MKRLKQFVVDSGRWGIASEIAALVFLGVGIWEHFRDRAVSSFSFLCAALVLFALGSYAAWNKTRDELEKEKVRNEIAPDIDVQISSMITKGKLGIGLTDLFVHVILTLKAPSEVKIRSFSMTGLQGTESRHVNAIEDTAHWEVVKENPDGGYVHISCTPIAKDLRQRGDPMDGWIHFQLSDMQESWLLKSVVWIKVNSAHGTCTRSAQGAYAFPDPKTKGVMRKLERGRSSF
jgi:hypothetical protein